jgi:hypothetical protein
MLRLAKAFWDISIWRRTPAQLPASLFLLVLVATTSALIEVLSAFLPPVSTGRLFLRVLLSVGLPLLFAWTALAVAGRQQRFLQTGSALLGVWVLAQLALYPIQSLIEAIGAERLAAVPLGVLWLLGLIWYILAGANIWRAALDSGIAVGVAVSVGCFVVSILVQQQLLPAT